MVTAPSFRHKAQLRLHRPYRDSVLSCPDSDRWAPKGDCDSVSSTRAVSAIGLDLRKVSWPDAYELRSFAARYPDAAWASWGDYDARQLERDAGFAACRSLLEGLQHFNARKWHKCLYDNQPKGLKQTVDWMGLVWQGTYHRGIDDARNVAAIVIEMLL